MWFWQRHQIFVNGIQSLFDMRFKYRIYHNICAIYNISNNIICTANCETTRYDENDRFLSLPFSATHISTAGQESWEKFRSVALAESEDACNLVIVRPAAVKMRSERADIEYINKILLTNKAIRLNWYSLLCHWHIL